MKNIVNLKEGSVPAHTNRIFTLKFIDDNENLLMSAGWDETLLFWDLRIKSSQNFIYGPLICGDALDYKDNTILTGKIYF